MHATDQYLSLAINNVYLHGSYIFFTEKYIVFRNNNALTPPFAPSPKKLDMVTIQIMHKGTNLSQLLFCLSI